MGVVGGPAAVGYFVGKGAAKAGKARGGMGGSSITGSTISPEETKELTFYFGAGAGEGARALRNVEREVVAEDLQEGLGKQDIYFRGKEFRGPGKSTVITKAEQRYGDLTREFEIYGDVVPTAEEK